jgi:hypothetical protein
MREHFAPTHPIRLLMSPFYYKSAMVGRKAIASLVPYQGIILTIRFYIVAANK